MNKTMEMILLFFWGPLNSCADESAAISIRTPVTGRQLETLAAASGSARLRVDRPGKVKKRNTLKSF